MATQDTNNNGAPSNVEIQGFTGEDDDIRDEDIPQLTSVVAQCRFWWKVSMWPLVFLVANAIVIFSLLLEESEEERWIRTSTSTSHYGKIHYADERLVKPEFSSATNAAIWTVVLLLDAIAFYKAAKVVERQIIAMESDSEVSSPSSLSHLYVYAQVSKMADTFLSRGRSTHNVAFSVNCLLLAFTIALSASLVTVATALHISLGPGLGDCLTNEVITHDMNNSAIPEELKDWASGGGNYGEANYIHLADGTIFFSGQNSTNGYGTHLVMAMANGTFKIFSDFEIGMSEGFLAIEKNATNFPSGMCLIYWLSEESDRGISGDPIHQLLCYNSSDKVFRNTTMPSLDSKSRDSLDGYSERWYSTQWLNHTVWVRATFSGWAGDVRTGIYKADYENMTWTNVVEPEPYRPPNQCLNYLHWLDIGVGTIALIFSSFWLLKIQGIPAGMVPLTSFFITVLSSVSYRLGFLCGIMGAIAAAASLVGRSLPARMNREMVLWTLYTILICLLFPLDYLSWTLLLPSEYRYFASNHGFTAIALVLLVVIGLVLNHPVLQVMGWVSAMGTVVITISSFVTPNSDDIFLVIPIGIVISCGLVSAGYHLTRYRAYIIWYSRRLWRALNELSPGRRAANTHSPDGNLTQHLASSRAHSP
jgi:hypothetical protein